MLKFPNLIWTHYIVVVHNISSVRSVATVGVPLIFKHISLYLTNVVKNTASSHNVCNILQMYIKSLSAPPPSL